MAYSKHLKKISSKSQVPTSWDAVAGWYAGWVGENGCKHHRELAIPAVLDLLEPLPNEKVLDIGAGSGILAPYIAKHGVEYTGIDASSKLIKHARKQHGHSGRFITGDAAQLAAVPGLQAGSFDAVIFMLSIQDMEPLDAVLASAVWALKSGGRAIILMNHPCFRVPRQSGWGWDDGRNLRYRRVDRYLTPLAVPVEAYHRQGRGITLSFHRPLEDYINYLSDNGLLVERIKEIASYPAYHSPSKAENTANQEIPIFLGLRAFNLNRTAQ